jgi:hypothetical protein
VISGYFSSTSLIEMPCTGLSRSSPSSLQPRMHARRINRYECKFFLVTTQRYGNQFHTYRYNEISAIVIESPSKYFFDFELFSQNLLNNSKYFGKSCFARMGFKDNKTEYRQYSRSPWLSSPPSFACPCSRCYVRVRIKHFIETNETEIEAETQSRRR